MEPQNSFLGTGWRFPPAFDNKTGAALMVSDEEDIRQSLQIILGTRPGERVMQPEFGCNLDIMLFEPLTATLITEVRDIITTAITYFEPRIELIKVDISTIDELQGLIIIKLDYEIRSYNSRYNLVYPFYLEEGASGNTEQYLLPKDLIL